MEVIIYLVSFWLIRKVNDFVINLSLSFKILSNESRSDVNVNSNLSLVRV